jgi:hypothetical protein
VRKREEANKTPTFFPQLSTPGSGLNLEGGNFKLGRVVKKSLSERVVFDSKSEWLWFH